MKLLYISKYLSVPKDGETGARGFHLCRELSKEGNDVTIMTTVSHFFSNAKQNTKTFEVEKFGNLDVIYVKTLSFKRSNSMRRILSWVEFELKVLLYVYLKNVKPDITIASSLSLLSALSAITISYFRKSKFVFEVRDIWPLTIIEEMNLSPFNPAVMFLSAIETLAYKRADLIVGTMANLQEHVRNKTTKHANVKCIPQGYSKEIFDSLEEIPDFDTMQLIASQFKDGVFNICYTGSLGKANALEYIFETAAALQHNQNINFVFFGAGDLKDGFHERYGGLPNVRIGPKLRRQDVASALNMADLCIFSTNQAGRWKYGQSLNKIVDYMLNAKPIYAIYSGFDTMIADADCGFISGSHDPLRNAKKIEDIAKLDTQALADMGMRGRVWLQENRSFPKLAQDYKRILTQL